MLAFFWSYDYTIYRIKDAKLIKMERGGEVPVKQFDALIMAYGSFIN